MYPLMVGQVSLDVRAKFAAYQAEIYHQKAH